MLHKQQFFITLFFTCFLYSVGVKSQEYEMQRSPLAKEKEAEANYIEAVKYRMLGDEKQEEELLKQVIKSKSDEAAPYYDLAKLYLRQQKIDDAEYNIKKAIERGKTNAWYKKLYADILVMENKPEKAADIFWELSKTERHNHEYPYQAVKLYEKANKPKVALKVLDEVIEKYGNDEILLMEKEQIFLHTNKLDEAIKIAEKLIELNPKEGRFYLNLGEIYNNNKQPNKAIEVYQKAIKLFPDEPSLQYGLANYYKSIKDTAHYREYISKAVLNPEFDNETKVNILISFLQELGLDTTKKNQGIELTSKLAEQNADDASITALYAQVLWNTGNSELAAEWYKKSIAIDPDKFTVWQQLLLCYSGAKDADSLLKFSAKAIKYFPNQSMFHYLNGMGQFYKKNYPPAITAINRAINLQPEENKALLSDMYSSLGDIYNATNEFVLSDTCLEKSLRMNPNNPSVLNNYAYYLSVRGVRLSEAERMSKKSLEIRPGEATFLDTYGWIFYKEGDYQDAKKFIEDAINADKDADGTVWEHLGDTLFKLNDIDKAVDCWKKAKEKGNDNNNIDKKIQDRKLYE